MNTTKIRSRQRREHTALRHKSRRLSRNTSAASRTTLQETCQAIINKSLRWPRAASGQSAVLISTSHCRQTGGVMPAIPMVVAFTRNWQSRNVGRNATQKHHKQMYCYVEAIGSTRSTKRCLPRPHQHPPQHPHQYPPWQHRPQRPHQDPPWLRIAAGCQLKIAACMGSQRHFVNSPATWKFHIAKEHQVSATAMEMA